MEKQRWEESEKRRAEERRSEKRTVRRKKMQVREKVGKSRNTVFFQWFVGPEGRNAGSLKRRVEPSGQMRDEIVAWSTCRSQIVENTSASEHFRSWDVKKSARRCGAKHISKSKGTKHHMFAPLLDVEASFCVAGARDSAPCQKWVKREGIVAVSITTTITLHYTTLHSITLHSITPHYTALHHTTLHYTTLRYPTLPYTTLHTLHPQLQIQLHLQLH